MEKAGNNNGHGNGSLEIKTPFMSARLGGKDLQIRDVLTVAILVVVVLTGFGVYQLVPALRDLAAAQRLTACLISIDMPRRETAFSDPNSLCNRMARMQ